MKGIILALAVLPAMAAADHYTTTYLCKKADGTKAAQDTPCDGTAGAAQTGVVPTYKRDPTIQDLFDAIPAKVAASQRRIMCPYMRQTAQQQSDANRTELNKRTAGIERQNAINDREYVAQNCTPYGQ